VVWRSRTDVLVRHPEAREAALSPEFRSALAGVQQNGKTQPVICVELEKNLFKDVEILRKELLALAEKFPHTKDIKTILFHPSFPVDIRHNAKIFREKLALWAQQQTR